VPDADIYVNQSIQAVSMKLTLLEIVFPLSSGYDTDQANTTRGADDNDGLSCITAFVTVVI